MHYDLIPDRNVKIVFILKEATKVYVHFYFWVVGIRNYVTYIIGDVKQTSWWVKHRDGTPRIILGLGLVQEVGEKNGMA